MEYGLGVGAKQGLYEPDTQLVPSRCQVTYLLLASSLFTGHLRLSFYFPALVSQFKSDLHCPIWQPSVKGVAI